MVFVNLLGGSMEERRFKDVFDVLDAEKDKSSRSSWRLSFCRLMRNSIQYSQKHLLHLPHCSQATTLKVDRELLGKSHTSPQWHGGLKPTEIVVLKPNLGKLVELFHHRALLVMRSGKISGFYAPATGRHKHLAG
ncbi:unnamed protein product [Microthlaspi erraticum]|uniref:Uncharacterized protein n=1 Tax=Microthlaspi erraticum TaxID=1685480 RepID=A0A6D2JQW1_9BRAS|nr:unnamed protein product [Microthlaspi erraticum]